MNDINELIECLREHADWADANEWEVPITLGDDLREAAEALERLNDLSEIQCARLLAENARLHAKLEDWKRRSAWAAGAHDCNDCGVQKNCKYRPGWGEMVRINCPLWEEAAHG